MYIVKRSNELRNERRKYNEQPKHGEQDQGINGTQEDEGGNRSGDRRRRRRDQRRHGRRRNASRRSIQGRLEAGHHQPHRHRRTQEDDAGDRGTVHEADHDPTLLREVRR